MKKFFLITGPIFSRSGGGQMTIRSCRLRFCNARRGRPKKLGEIKGFRGVLRFYNEFPFCNTQYFAIS